jgi:hypothetical protein
MSFSDIFFTFSLLFLTFSLLFIYFFGHFLDFFGRFVSRPQLRTCFVAAEAEDGADDSMLTFHFDCPIDCSTETELQLGHDSF